MAQIPGRLVVDSLPDGTLRLAFLPTSGDKDAAPITLKDLNVAEFFFLTCGLSPERATALRDEVRRNKVASVDVSFDGDIAARLRYTFPAK
jgi:hypothetical protein